MRIRRGVEQWLVGPSLEKQMPAMPNEYSLPSTITDEWYAVALDTPPNFDTTRYTECVGVAGIVLALRGAACPTCPAPPHGPKPPAYMA
mmetsp:Transcript_1975/g.5766  ORF Transcript_1975/g.5766 Transcript_1975/m.5766 type:complete len:89 (-) Transcript_1975:3-269(-)